MRPALYPILLGSQWTPSRLFGGVDTGDWWSAASGENVRQESAGTTPSVDGDVVGLMRGLKNGIGLTQGTSSKKPSRHLSGGNWYVETDGIDDFLKGSFTLVNPITRITCFNAVALTLNHSLFDGGSSGTANFYVDAATPRLTMYQGLNSPTTTAVVAGAACVVTEIYNGAASKLGVNGGALATGNPGSATPGGFTWGTSGGGASASATNMQFYGGIVIGRVLTDTEIRKCHKYFGALAGLAL